MQVLDHERLEVYQVARELSREVNRIMKKVRRKRDQGDIFNQAWRATSSIPLNICEGSGEESPGRKAYFYRIARGSADELSGSLDHMVDLEMLDANVILPAKTLIVRIVSMLFKLTHNITTPDSFPALPRRRPPRQR